MAQPGHPAGAPLTVCGWKNIDLEDVPWGRWMTPQKHGRTVFLISDPPQHKATHRVQDEKHWLGPRRTVGRTQVCKCWVETQAAVREEGARKTRKSRKLRSLKQVVFEVHADIEEKPRRAIQFDDTQFRVLTQSANVERGFLLRIDSE